MQNLPPLRFLCLATILFVVSCKSDPKTDSNPSDLLVNSTVSTRLDAEPDNLSPFLARTAVARTVFRNIYSTLLEYDPYQLDLTPVLAKAKPVINKDKQTGNYTYSYEIRDEAKWDDGSPITGEDYVFTIKAIFNPKVGSRYKPALDFIGDVKVDASNPKKFTVYTKECYIGAEENISTIQVMPAYNFDPDGLMKAIPLSEFLDDDKAKKLVDNENIVKFAELFTSAPYARAPGKVVGSGPYKLVEFTTDQKIVLEKKRDWWGNQLAASVPIFIAKPNKIVYKVVPDVTAALTMLKNGELDVMGKIPNEEFFNLKNNELAKKNLNFFTPSAPAYYYFAINNERPHLSDKRVRRALAHVVDLEDYIENTARGNAKKITGPILPTKSYFNKNLKIIDYDLAKAKSILDEAGWKDTNGDGVRDKKVNGQQLDLKVEILLPNSSVDGKTISQLMEVNAKKAGIDIDLVIKDSKAARTDLVKGNYDLYLSGSSQTLGLDDPQNKFHTAKIPPNGGNIARCGSPEMDAIIDDIISSCDDKALRDKKYSEFQEKLYDEQPFIFLFTNKETLAINKRFGNAKGSTMRPGFFENRFIANK